MFLLLSIAPAPRAAQSVTPEAGITGRVLTPDGTPVTQGNVTLMTFPTNRVSAAIDHTGHFRIVPDAQGGSVFRSCGFAAIEHERAVVTTITHPVSFLKEISTAIGDDIDVSRGAVGRSAGTASAVIR